jgi:hypothetical protein
MKDLDAIQSLHRFEVKMLHHFKMNRFKAAQLLHCCKGMILAQKISKLQMFKRIKLQSRGIDSFLRKQSVAVIDYFFLNHAHYSTAVAL